MPVRSILQALAAGAALFATASAQTPPAVQLAPGVHLLQGAILPDRGPDGNTVLFETRGGLVVVDTGRHPWHSDAILAFAGGRGVPVTAMVNTHWHLDHASGNRRIKARFPAAQVYASNAVARALEEGGFLQRERARTEARRAEGTLGAVEDEESRLFLETMAAQDNLRPDKVVMRNGVMRIGGRRLDLRVAERAVTDADLWIFDRGTRIAVLGDLVTLPAPFFETACPQRWRAALDSVWATPFTLAVPGHGAPMDRDAFDIYRRAFGAFLDCVASDAEARACAAAWARSVTPLTGADPDADAYARYYVDFLRRNGGQSPDCLD